jgi:glycosyltransferase involved in cell wall biosynthesis
MTLLLILLALISALELLASSRELWSVHRPLAAGLGVVLALVSGGIFGIHLSVLTGLIAILSLYRVVNLLRLFQNRTEEHRLRQTAWRTSLTLITAQVLLFIGLAIDMSFAFSTTSLWIALGIVQLLIAVGLYVSTNRQLRKLVPPSVEEHFSDSQLPSLSVCIPARNETQSLEQCLRSLVANDYPKLEILVLDDCSQSSKTSDIIRSYAHQGVRFIQGTPPEDKWLAKNWAYQQLFTASSAELVLFCGVDVRFQKQSLRQMVSLQLQKHKKMQSVVPINTMPLSLVQERGLLIQPARYAWEVCLPRRRFNRPPVLSSCWLAERKLISGAGGFAAISGSVSPESHFARRALAADAYSFVASTNEMGIISRKSAEDQWNTAVRTRYPQLHKRPEMVAAVSMAEIVLLIGPLLLAIGAGIAGNVLLGTLASLAFLIESAVYSRIVNLTYRQILIRGWLLLIPAILLDIYIRHESMWRYEFGEVTWKGRNVCLPIMRVIPRFPQV